MDVRTLARLVLVTALALVALGGVVHTTGSSLACPDWPLCNGEVAPRMEGGVLYEHSHRLLALAVLTGVIALPFVARGRERRLAIFGAVLVIVQALLGATTVILRLPPIVSILHLGTATALVSLLTMLATTGGVPSGDGAPAREVPRSAHLGPVIALVAVQVLLGAAVRHLGASAACGRDMLTCNGELVPPHGLGWLHLTHRAVGFLAAGAVMLVGFRIARAPSIASSTRALAYALVVAAPGQIVLGLISVAVGPRVLPVTSHLVLGELLVVGLVHLAVRAPALTPRSLAPLRPPLAARTP